MPILDVDHVSHAYGQQAVVRDLSFDLAQGEIACLLGSSGCGKTTMLRLIAGFEMPSAGSIRLNGVTIASEKTQVPAEARRIGMVFQDYALFPHLSIADNIGFGLGKESAPARRRRIDEMLELIGLAQHGERYPHELSGGQQQRVALARALAPQPHLLLLDEPFSNLDVELRERLSLEVRDILKRAGMAAILVTHDQNEAFAVSDMVGIMREGRIEQWDTPYNL
ncbi:MAG: ABC transporter ATP-binding protein, partial [Sulfuritalea sp.]|nr:ABC transporter ATP-binding protein [Sulfuritalea sp.]